MAVGERRRGRSCHSPQSARVRLYVVLVSQLVIKLVVQYVFDQTIFPRPKWVFRTWLIWNFQVWSPDVQEDAMASEGFRASYLYFCWTCKQKCLLNIKIQATYWSGDKGADKHRLLEAQWRLTTQNGPRRSDLWRMRQNLPETNPSKSFKQRTRGKDISSMSTLHDKSSLCSSRSKKWRNKSRNSLQRINHNGTWFGRKVCSFLWIPEQTRKRNACPRTLLDLR